MTNETLRTDFLKVYANLPINLREETIYIFNNQPVSWFVCYLEITEKTKLGDDILKRLKKMKII